MSVFKFKAISDRGEKIVAHIESYSLVQAKESIRNLGLTLIEIGEEKVNFFDRIGSYLKIPNTRITLFSKEMAVMLRAGISIRRAVSSICAHDPNRRFAKILGKIARRLDEGYSFYGSLFGFPQAFSKFYVAMIKMGETMGELPQIFENLAKYIDRDISIRNKIKAALVYPAFVVFSSVGAVVMLMSYFIPTFIKMYKEMKVSLPAPTQFLIDLYNIFSNWTNIAAALLIIALFLIFFSAFIRLPHGRYFFDSFKLQMPLLGNLFKKELFSRFSLGLYLMYGSGINILKCFEILEETLRNEVIRRILADVRLKLKDGELIASIFKTHEIVPILIVHIFKVAEQTGTIESACQRLYEFYELELDYTLTSVLSLIEPILISVLAVIVGFVMIAIFLPIYGIVSNL